jgi:hypothetical protein
MGVGSRFFEFRWFTCPDSADSAVVRPAAIPDPAATHSDNPTARRNRRTRTRYALVRNVLYRAQGFGGITGSGLTVNLSSAGVLFTTAHLLPRGQSVDLAISWPVRRDGGVPVELRIRGLVARSDEGWAAVAIDEHEFVEAVA